MFLQKKILKSNTLDKIIQARKKLFYHVIVKNYLWNVLRKFLIKFESTWLDGQKQLPEVFYEKSCS